MGSPIVPSLAIVGLTLAFMGLLFGQSLAESSYPAFKSVDFGACSGNALDEIACWIGNVGAIVFNFFAFIYGTIVFFIALLTFNVPGAPTWIRFLVGTMIGGTVLWALATTLLRGSKG
jgi:hypothetical protein